MSPRTFEITMDSNVDDVVVVAAMVRALLDQLHVTQRDADQVELCLTEALVNTVRHAYAGRSGSTVTLRFKLGKSDISFEVEDYGQGAEKQRLEAAIASATDFDPQDPSTLRDGGRGMFIIHQVMDQWDYFSDSGRNLLTMSKRVSAST